MARDVTTYEVRYCMGGKWNQMYIGEDRPFAESIAKAVKINNSIPVKILETHFKNGRRKEEITYTVNPPHRSDAKEIVNDAEKDNAPGIRPRNCEIPLKRVTNPSYNRW